MPLIKNENIIIVRPGTGTYTKGHFVPASDTVIRIAANVQPVNGEELLLLPEGNRKRGTIKIYSETEIIDNDRIRLESANTAQVVTCTVDNVIDETDYSITINGNDYEYESGIGATNLTIVVGIVAAIELGSEPITIVDNEDGTYTLTADTEGTSFTIEIDENQSYVTDTANVLKQYEIMQDKDYSPFNISHYKTYGFLMGT
jgi:hypothetical protein